LPLVIRWGFDAFPLGRGIVLTFFGGAPPPVLCLAGGLPRPPPPGRALPPPPSAARRPRLAASVVPRKTTPPPRPAARAATARPRRGRRRYRRRGALDHRCARTARRSCVCDRRPVLRDVQYAVTVVAPAAYARRGHRQRDLADRRAGALVPVRLRSPRQLRRLGEPAAGGGARHPR